MSSKASITVLGPPEEVQRRWQDDQYRPDYIDSADAAVSFSEAPGDRGTDVALAAFELMSLAITDPTGDGDYHGDVEAVRQANQENPHRKIHEGPPAVKASNGSAPAAEEAVQSA